MKRVLIGVLILAALAASFIFDLGTSMWWVIGKSAAGVIVLLFSNRPPRRKQEDPVFKLCENRA